MARVARPVVGGPGLSCPVLALHAPCVLRAPSSVPSPRHPASRSSAPAPRLPAHQSLARYAATRTGRAPTAAPPNAPAPRPAPARGPRSRASASSSRRNSRTPRPPSPVAALSALPWFAVVSRVSPRQFTSPFRRHMPRAQASRNIPRRHPCAGDDGCGASSLTPPCSPHLRLPFVTCSLPLLPPLILTLQTPHPSRLVSCLTWPIDTWTSFPHGLPRVVCRQLPVAHADPWPSCSSPASAR